MAEPWGTSKSTRGKKAPEEPSDGKRGGWKTGWGNKKGENLLRSQAGFKRESLCDAGNVSQLKDGEYPWKSHGLWRAG